MKSERWKWALVAGAALAGGWTYDLAGIRDDPGLRGKVDSAYTEYLLQHDTAAYIYHTLGWDSLPPELPYVPGCPLIYPNKICVYGKIIQIDTFLSIGALYLIEVKELFWGNSSSDTLRIYLAFPTISHPHLPLEGDSLFIAGSHFPWWFIVCYKEARDSLYNGTIPDPYLSWRRLSGAVLRALQRNYT
ncbi:MAG: hypothetical protein ACP5QG_02060 [candidate division WOR-3 bacterium]